MTDSELIELDEMIRQAWNHLGPPVAKTLVESFDTKSEYGANSPQAIAARATLRSLMGETVKPPIEAPQPPVESPSAASMRLFREAPVWIPNQRSSSEPRRRGRSID